MIINAVEIIFSVVNYLILNWTHLPCGKRYYF